MEGTILVVDDEVNKQLKMQSNNSKRLKLTIAICWELILV